MNIHKKICMLAIFFSVFNLQANESESKQSRMVSVNITAEVITAEQALIMLGKNAIKNPFDFMLDLIKNRFNDFIFTIDNITYIVQSDVNPTEPVVDTPAANCITAEITAQVISPLHATTMLIKAATKFFTANIFHKPSDFLTYLFNQSPEGFVFTIDNMTYMIRS